MSERLPVPATVPALAFDVIPWARRHVTQVARRYHYESIDELWDETISALVRAVAYYDGAAGKFGPYARTAIHRACARVVDVSRYRRANLMRRHTVPLDDVADLFTSPSAEQVAIARETVLGSCALLRGMPSSPVAAVKKLQREKATKSCKSVKAA